MLRSNEIKKILSRPVVHIFVDGGDLFASLESHGPDHILQNPSHGAAGIMHFCRALGDVSNAHVFDDEWSIEKQAWMNRGFHCVDVRQDTNGDSRVIALFTLRVHEAAVKVRGPSVFVLVAGGADYTELIRTVSRRGVRTVVIGVNEDIPKSMAQAADVWVPIHEVVKDVSQLSDDGARSYDWAEFVKLLHSLENSKLNFVGVKYFIREVLPSIGVSDPSQKHVMIETAESLGIIEIYQESNKKGKRHNPVRACKLVRSNPVVQEVLGAMDA